MPLQLGSKIEQEQLGNDGLHRQTKQTLIRKDEKLSLTEGKNRAVSVPPERARKLRGETNRGKLEQCMEPEPYGTGFGELGYRAMELMIIQNYYKISMWILSILRG